MVINQYINKAGQVYCRGVRLHWLFDTSVTVCLKAYHPFLPPSKGFQLPPKCGNGFWDSDLYGPHILVDGRELYLDYLFHFY